MNKSLVFLVALFLSACSPNKFISSDFDSKSAAHKQVAILPFELAYTGRLPKNLSAEDLEKVRHAEALAFQKSLYDNILKEKGEEKKDIKIDIQPLEKTNRILLDNGINYLAQGGMEPQNLCKLLGVDAIVYSKTEKERYHYDLDTFGIFIAPDVLERVKQSSIELNSTQPAIPGNMVHTYTINSVSQLKNGADGALLWQFTVSVDAEWSAPSSHVVELVTTRFAKKFPYRKRH